ncbi:MAG TPA: sensor histidine kinase [Bryobacteraceae bacterium]|nr:sensor histidine kinase [Bryobacteraceae bacterium]
MPGISQRRFYSTIRRPAADALEILAANSDDIFATWQREVRALGLLLGEFVPAASLNFAQLAENLRKVTYPAFRQRLLNFGETLAQRGVRLDIAVAALNRLFEICLPCLIQDLPERSTPILALARLHALAELLIVSGYTGQWASGKKTLVEASLSEAEDRRYGASAYVTRVYEQERRRLSHDLHDEIGHDLIIIKLHLEMIALSHDGKDLEAENRLMEAIALVSHAIDAVRRLVFDLGPAVLEHLGFLPAVKSYISQFSARTKINVKLREGYLPVDIPSSHQVAIYRLLQGALSNVLKHASAKNVNISLGSMKDIVLIMVIEDDGVGFDTASRSRRHSFGLTAMRERVEVLGGKMHLQSKPATPMAKVHGTRIEIDLPLPGGVEQ